MGNVNIRPGHLSGVIKAPPSKSLAHRALFCAALSGKECIIHNVGVNNDVKATIACLSNMGTIFTVDGNTFTVDGRSMKTSGHLDLNCKESGATIRFSIPVAAALGLNASFYGTGNLPNRSVKEFMRILPEHGVKAFKESTEIISISGKLTGSEYRFSSKHSSQFVSGIMLALPYLKQRSVIKLSEEAFHGDHLFFTTDIQQRFGVVPKIDYNEKTVTFDENNYSAAEYTVEGDYSLAAQYLVAGAIGDGVTIECLPARSGQPERSIVNILSDCGAKIIQTDNFVTVSRDRLSPIDVDCAEIPHLMPILAVLSCFIDGTSRLRNCGLQHYNESDRVTAICEGLKRFGAYIDSKDGDIIIHGHGSLDGGTAHDFGDHRIAMALSVAAAFSDCDSEIASDNTVNKSYPTFFSDFSRLGGKCRR